MATLPPRHPDGSGRFIPRGATDDLGDAQPHIPSAPITRGAEPGSATPGQTGGIFVPAAPGSRGGGTAQNRPLRPMAKAGTDQSGGAR
jgi:hypothetical protein